MMAHVLEHRDIESHGLKLIVQKQGALLLKEVVNYTLFMTKTEARCARLRSERSGFEPWPRGHCVVFLGKTFYSHSASLHPGV